jgi:hypothetical protein
LTQVPDWVRGSFAVNLRLTSLLTTRPVGRVWSRGPRDPPPEWFTAAPFADAIGHTLTKTKLLVISGEIRSVKAGGNDQSSLIAE